MKNIEWAIKEIECLETESSQNYPHEEMVEKELVLDILKQLDEPVYLTQEWIDDNKEMYLINDTSENAVPDYKLRKLLVPKKEEPETVYDVMSAFSKAYERLKKEIIEELKKVVE